jgi:hypothetical protein
MIENSYWNIDSILLGMTKKECKLNYDLDFLKELFPGQENSTQFKKNEMVKLPLTLAITLYNAPDQNKYVSIQTPSTLTDEYYFLLKADPVVPNFNNNKYIYDEYLLLKDNINIDKKWDQCLINTNFKRYLYYYNNSFNIKNINNIVEKKTSKNEQAFFNKMVHINNNNKYFQENYSNNNKVLEEKIEAKKNRHKIKLANSNI